MDASKIMGEFMGTMKVIDCQGCQYDGLGVEYAESVDAMALVLDKLKKDHSLSIQVECMDSGDYVASFYHYNKEKWLDIPVTPVGTMKKSVSNAIAAAIIWLDNQQ